MDARSLLWCVAGVLTLMAGISQVPGAELLWDRAEVLEQVAGVVEIRGPVQAQLELPDALCPEAAFACSADHVYRFVLGLQFVQEIDRAGEGDADMTRELVDRGSLLIALDLEPDAEYALREGLERRLHRLTAAEFARARAGLGFLVEPFEMDSIRDTRRPGWFCRRLDDAPVVDVIASPDEPRASTWSRAGEIAARGCASVETALAGLAPRTIRTLPAVSRLRRREVRFARGSTLAGATWADALAELGDTVQFRKKDTGGRLTGSIRDWRNGVFRGHEGRVGGVERTVLLGPAAFDLAGRPAWGARFTFEGRVETFGGRPALSPPERREVTVGIVPIRDPLMPEADAQRRPLSVPEDRLLTEVVDTLDASASPGPEDVVEALADPDVWPATGDWLVVLCQDDGTASYGIAPFVNRVSEVTNAVAACAAVELVLGER